MKIEIAESLMLSWLRHVRGCQIVQLNWKPSDTWKANEPSKADTLYAAAQRYFASNEINIFKKNASASQLGRQAEIDALGIELGDSSRIIAVDVAFHGSGLNYGSKSETAARVAKKMLRTLMVLESYFPEMAMEIVFATPKMNPAQCDAIDAVMELLDQFLEAQQFSAEFRIIANESFYKEVVEPVTSLADRVADTSELFMRGYQLIGLGKKSSVPIASNRVASVRDDEEEAEVPIGRFVQQEFSRLLSEGRLDERQIEQLCSVDYSRQTFGLRYPVLKHSNDPADRFDEHGNGRYYSKPLEGKFLLCNDWYKRNRRRLNAWLGQFGEPTREAEQR